VGQPRKSNWYSNSAAFGRVLAQAAREPFGKCTRLRHLRPATRRTIRRKERRLMVKEAEMRYQWLRECIHFINRCTPILWYRGHPPMFDFLEMEGLSGHPAYRAWEEWVKEFRYKVSFAWTKGQVDEIERLDRIGMHHHTDFLRALNDIAWRGDKVKTDEMAFSAHMQARMVKVLISTPHYRQMMQPLDYSVLFRGREVKRMVPAAHQFLWTVYYDVRADMMHELAAFAGPSPPPATPHAGRDGPPCAGRGAKKEMIAWLTAPSEEKKKSAEQSDA